jgi:hypothetical protein
MSELLLAVAADLLAAALPALAAQAVRRTTRP